MKRSGASTLLAVIAVLLIAQGALQRAVVFPFWSKNYNSSGGKVNSAMDPQQMLFALLGFRELLAGILWVRADAFFDTGNYDAILPLIRLVTILDPQEIDVYATGMWHIGYNFTDEEQRSDRRYIPSALALGKEGAEKNPDTYEMFFETGWMWWHKVDDDYDKSVHWFKESQKRADILPARKDILVQALQRDGKVEEALDTLFRLQDDGIARRERDPSHGADQTLNTVVSNLDSTLVRMVQRGLIAEEQGRPITGYDVSPPFDVGFSAKVTVLEPMVLRVEGTWNVLPVGTRVRFILRDIDYPHAIPGGMVWDFSDDVNLDPPRDKTYMMDQLFVKNRRFNRKVDMSKDPTMYPFTSDKYLLEFYYNPRSAPAHIQDKFGWNGEGMTDKNYLNTDVRKGQKVVYCSFEVTRDQLLRHGEWQDKVPLIKTPNFVERKGSYQGKDEVTLDIPSLRGGGATAPSPKTPVTPKPGRPLTMPGN